MLKVKFNESCQEEAYLKFISLIYNYIKKKPVN